MKKTSTKKRFADFQDRYRRSSNFNSASKKVQLVLNEEGQLVLKKSPQK